MRRAEGSSRQGGMTLIEVMVAVMILAMIAVMVSTGVGQMTRNRRTLDRQLDRAHVIRAALERMTRELSMAYVSVHTPRTGAPVTMATCFIGRHSMRGDRLDFTSFSHRRLYRDAHESDQNEISYFMADDPEDSSVRVLARREQRRIDEDPQHGGQVQIMVRDVVGLEFEYLDHVTGEWVESWNSTDGSSQPNRIPMQVKIRLFVRNSRGQRRVYSTRANPQIIYAVNHARYRAL